MFAGKNLSYGERKNKTELNVYTRQVENKKRVKLRQQDNTLSITAPTINDTTAKVPIDR